jgi:hypothetical protein
VSLIPLVIVRLSVLVSFIITHASLNAHQMSVD